MRRSLFRRASIFVICGMLAGAPSFAADESDWLPETSAVSATHSSPLGTGRMFIDLAADYAHRSDPLGARRHANVGLDGYASRVSNHGVRALLSGRVDVDSQPGAGLTHRNLSLTVREAYVGGDFGNWTIEAGRMNIRDGVAIGYSPTDVFRAGSLPVRRTEDPARLRESRLGVVGLRVQRRTPWGDFTALAAPKLGVTQEPSWYDPMWGAVNDGRAQLYLKYTPLRWHGMYSNVIWHEAEGGARTFGLNATNNIGQSMVAYAELVSTRQSSLAALVSEPSAPRTAFFQWSAGLSVSTDWRQTVTLELAHNAGGIRRGDWTGPWQLADADRLGAVFAEAAHRQDPLSRNSAMLLLQWDRFGHIDVDLTCLARLNFSDESRLGWCEWRYKQPAAEWSLSLSRFHGGSRSEFGAAQQPWAVGAKARFFF